MMENQEPIEFLPFVDKNSSVFLEFPSTIDVLLSYLGEYASTMENSIEKKKADLRKRRDEAGVYEEREQLDEEFFITENLFPNLLRSSLFLATYSLFEDSLRNRCHCIGKTKKPSVLLEDTAGNGYVDQCKNYLHDTVQIDIDNTGDWETLLRYGELRNRVAHNQGRLSLGNEPLLRFIIRNPTLSREGDKVIFKKGFCQEVIRSIGTFFQTLDPQLPAECQDLEPHLGYRP